jgi:hypothetical protein
MKKKALIIATLVVVILLYFLFNYFDNPFYGDPAKGIVKNPAPLEKCATSKVIEIKCYKFKHAFNRKHYALNNSLLCLCDDQRIIIDHDVDLMYQGKHIEAEITKIVDDVECK